MVMKKNGLSRSLWLFFIFGSLFITIRLLVIGSVGSQTISEYLFSGLPEFFAFGIVGLFAVRYLRQWPGHKPGTLDIILIAYLITNVVFGTFLAHNLKVSVDRKSTRLNSSHLGI